MEVGVVDGRETNGIALQAYPSQRPLKEFLGMLCVHVDHLADIYHVLRVFLLDERSLPKQFLA